MADQQDQMTLVAKLVDQVSDKLKEINKAMLATEAASRKAHKGGAESAEKHRKSIELLHKSFEQIKEAAVEVVKPGFAAMGIAAFSLAGAIGAVIEAVKDLGEQGLAIDKVTRRSGLMADKIRELQGIGLRWNISIEQTNAGLSQFGDFMAQTERRAPNAMRTWMQMPGLWEKLGQSLEGLNKKQQLDKVLDFVTGRVKNIDQKRRILQLLGLPEDYAYQTKAELDKARHEEEKWVAAHPFNKKLAEKSDETFTALKRSFQGLKENLGGAFGEGVLHVVEAINHFLEQPENVAKITGAFKTLGDEVHHTFEDFHKLMDMIERFDKWRMGAKDRPEGTWGKGKAETPPKSDWTPYGLYDFFGLDSSGRKKPRRPTMDTRPADPLFTPTSFGGGSQSETARYVEEPVYRATLRALTDWYQQVLFGNKTNGGNGGGGGFQNASFGGSEGAAKGGGVSPSFGNKDYPNLDTPGGAGETGGGGGRAPAMPSGSKAQNAQRIYDELRRLGHSHEQASGALGHVQAESGFNPKVVGDRGTAFGFFQHRGDRWAKARRMSSDPFSPEAAARHFDSELRTNEARAGRSYFNSKSTRDAVTALNGYERFAGWQHGQAKRYMSAEQFARRMKPSEAAPTAPSAGPNFQDLWQDRYGATRPGVSSNTDRGLLKDSQSFNDRWNDRVNGNANISVDFKNMPHWARTAVDTEGKMFKELKINRGFSMPTANEDH